VVCRLSSSAVPRERPRRRTHDFPSLETLEEWLHGFARYYECIAQPFEWKFTRKDLESLMDRD